MFDSITPEMITPNLRYLLSRMEEVNCQMTLGKLILEIDSQYQNEHDIVYGIRVVLTYPSKLDLSSIHVQKGPFIKFIKSDSSYIDSLEEQTYKNIFYNHLTIGILLDLYLNKLYNLFNTSGWLIGIFYDIGFSDLYFTVERTDPKENSVRYKIEPNLNYGVLEPTIEIDMSLPRFEDYAHISCEFCTSRGSVAKGSKIIISNFDELDTVFIPLLNKLKGKVRKILQFLSTVEIP